GSAREIRDRLGRAADRPRHSAATGGFHQGESGVTTARPAGERRILPYTGESMARPAWPAETQGGYDETAIRLHAAEGGRGTPGGKVRLDLPQDAGERVYARREDQAGEGAGDPGVRGQAGEGGGRRPQPPGAAAAPLPALGALRQRHAVHVHRDLR